MSTLPPDASNAPQPADNEPEESTAAPRWAVPAVPPPWAGTGQTGPAAEQAADVAQPAAAPPAWAQPAAAPGQPVYGQPAYGQPAFGQPAYGQPPLATPPGWAQPGPAPQQFGQPVYGQPVAAPAVARNPLFNRQKWLPTASVAVVIAAVVLGGIGLDKVIAAPSAGKVAVGSSVTITAAPGWVRTDDGSSTAVVLQKANMQLTVGAQLYSGTAKDRLTEDEQSLKAEAAQISFGDEQEGTIAGHDAAMVGFEAVVTGSSGSGTIEGEVICLTDAGNVVEFVVVTAQGNLGSAADDIKAMVASVEVGQ